MDFLGIVATEVMAAHIGGALFHAIVYTGGHRGFTCLTPRRRFVARLRSNGDTIPMVDVQPSIDTVVQSIGSGGDLIELAILFLILALVAGVLGARGIAGLSMQIAKWLVIIFVVLAIIAFLL